MKTEINAYPLAICTKILIAAIALFLVTLPRIGASSSLVLIDSDVIINNGEGCTKKLTWNGWVCKYDHTAHNEFLQVANTAFEIQSFASVGAAGGRVTMNESWVTHDYRHQWQVGLDGPAGSQANVWLDAIGNGVVSAYGAGGAQGTAQGSVGLRLWQGAFSGWGYYHDPLTESDRYGPMLDDGTVLEPYLDRRWGERVFAIGAWYGEEELTANLHELLDLTLTAGDPATHLWIEAFLYTNADAVKFPVVPGLSDAEVDLYNGDRGFRYGLALDTTVPEPGTLALLGLGLVGVAASRRRKA